MNEFEEAIQNAPYSSNWAEQRDYIGEIMSAYIASSHCEWYTRKRTSLDSNNFGYIVFFKMFGNLYVWSEMVENGLRESAQLDVLYDYGGIVRVLYSNMENSTPVAPLAISAYTNNELFDYDD